MSQIAKWSDKVDVIEWYPLWHNVPAQGEIVLEPAARKIVVKDLVGR